MESSTRHRRRAARTAVAGVGLALLLTGCGFDAQTLQPYTPAHGTNVDGKAVKGRNLLVVTDQSGKGYVTGGLLTEKNDKLTQVKVVPSKQDGSTGSALTVSASPVDLPARQLVSLTDPAPKVTVTGDVKPGQVVAMTFSFASGEILEVKTPVMSSDGGVYKGISAAPVASASATPTP